MNMFDTFEPFQQLEIQEFKFKPNRFEIWKGGQMIKSGNTSLVIDAEKSNEKAIVNFRDESLFPELAAENEFDLFITSTDRLQLVKVPANGNSGNNMGITMFNTVVGPTRDFYEFEENEPYCCNMFLNQGKLEKITFSFSAPEKLIEFYTDEARPLIEEPEIIQLSKKIYGLYEEEKISDARPVLIQLYRLVKQNPDQLADISDFETLGKSFLFMIDQNLSDDIDTLQTISSLAYLFMSKAIEKDRSNPNLYKDRLLILKYGHESLKYTAMSALNLNAGGIMSFGLGNSDLQARDSLYKMEISDLESNPVLYMRFDLFSERKNEFDEMIRREFFRPELTKEEIIKSGEENHKKMLEYLNNMVLVNGDVDF